MKMKRIVILLPLIFCALISMMAQISVNAPSQVAVGEQFRLQYTVNTTDVKGFRAGNIPDAFDVLMGPSTSTQQSFQFVNGKSKSSSSVTYTYILLANKNGTFTISGAKAKVEGKDAMSNSVKITVSGKVNSSQGSQQAMANRGGGVRPSGSRISGNDLFIKVSANKTRVHEQEPILLTYKVYAQVELTQLEGKMPDLNGFHTQEVPLPQQKSFHIENVNGRPYRCVTWSQYVMFPQMTGKMKIPSIKFKGIVVQENTNIDPFEAFFNGGSGYVEVKKDIIAPGLTIQVDPLPQKPDNFSGGVGTFNITASLDKTSIKAGNPVKIFVTVSGNGNLKLITQPTLNLPKDFETYDPKLTDKTKLTTAGLEGSMIYEFLAVPRSQGKYEIPPVEFTYFDTKSNSFKTIMSKPLLLNVEKGNGKTGDMVDFSSKEDSDIHPLHHGLNEEEADDVFLFGSSPYIVLNTSVVFIFLVLLVIFRKKAMDMADIAGHKGKRANKVAGKRLKKASRLMAEGKSSEFYDEVLRALWGYISDKFSMSSSELSRENICDILIQKHTSEDDINSFIEALDECEYERYAPGDASGNMMKTYNKAVSAITNIEEGMKNKRKSSQAKSKANSTIITLFLVLALPFTSIQGIMAQQKATEAPAESYQDLKIKADNAYSNGNYQQAIIIYESLLKKHKNAELYYNLGNSYYRCDNYTKAVIAYERAQMLNPGNRDIDHNLKIVRSKTIDNIIPKEELFFVVWYYGIINVLSADQWAKTALASLIFSLILFLIYLFVENINIRRLSFWGSVMLMAVVVLGNIFAWKLKRYALDDKRAVVTDGEVTVRKSPTTQNSDTYTIHEGTSVKILDDTFKGWLQIELADGREGWISDKTVETLRED